MALRSRGNIQAIEQSGVSLPAPPEAGKILNSWDGLKNTLQPERLGDKDLVRARNVVLDDSGQPSRRRGYKLKLPGDVHSLFTSYEGVVLGVVNGSLGIINPDYSYEFLMPVGADPSAGTPQLVYSQVGDNVYYVSPVDRGIVNIPGRSWSDWGDPTDLWLSPVVNPTETLPPIAGRFLKQPPYATCITYFNGRLYLSHGPTLWATELYLYNFVDATAGYKLFEAEITMLGTVLDGIYVGTREGLWFLTGETYANMKRTRVMDSGVIPGSKVDIPSELANPPQVPTTATTPVEVSIIFMTTKGVCIASSGGHTTNMTEQKYVFPDSLSAVAMYRRQDGMNQYITTLESGGSPTQGAAIGDYLDVTIIRGSGFPNGRP
jgi:hypothetical protein